MLYTIIGSTFFYVTILGLILLLAKFGEKNNKNILLILAYILLISITIFRYDIGNDYYGMANRRNITIYSLFQSGYSVFDVYKYFEYRIEITNILFRWLFAWAKYPYVYYIGLYGLIQIYFLYQALDRLKGSHTLGLFVYVVMGFLFNSWDWVRQSTAIMIFLYAIPFIERKEWKRYYFYVFLAFLFHNSAIILAPLYFIRYFKLNKFIIISGLLLALLLFFSGILTNTLYSFTAYFSLVEGYENYADSMQSLAQAQSIFYKLRSLLYVCFYIIIILFLPKQDIVKRNLLFVGSFLFLVACGSQILQRISSYFLIISTISFPIAYKCICKNNKLVLSSLSIIILLLSFLWIRDIVTQNNRGCTPYDHVFSERFEKQWFRPKNY